MRVPLRLLLAALLVAAAGVVGAAVVSPPAAQAVDCRIGTLASSTKSAQDVFSGIVTSARGAAKESGDPGATYTQEIDVDRVYKGAISTQVVDVQTERTPRDPCALGMLSVDREYLFFTQQDGDVYVADGAGGTAPASDVLVARVESLLGNGRTPTPPEPVEATFTPVADDEPTSLSRAAAPGVALLLVGLLGLVVVRRVGGRHS